MGRKRRIRRRKWNAVNQEAPRKAQVVELWMKGLSYTQVAVLLALDYDTVAAIIENRNAGGI